MNGGFELTREETRALADEVLAALGVTKGDMDDEERANLRRMIDDWRRRRQAAKDEGHEGL